MEVIHKELVNDIAIVLYTTEPRTERWAYTNKRMLTVAFFERNEDGEWYNVGPNSWNYYEDEAMNAYFQRLHAYDRYGNREVDIDVVFGEVNSERIRVVDAASEDDNKFQKIPLIETETGRYFLYVGNKEVVRAIAKNGTILSERKSGQKKINDLKPAIPGY
jgi:hypothetical protein